MPDSRRPESWSTTHLTHLAYAEEIAQARLRRQQAKSVVQLDKDRRAAIVGNLLVVLCGEADVTPVVNAGSLAA